MYVNALECLCIMAKCCIQVFIMAVNQLLTLSLAEEEAKEEEGSRVRPLELLNLERLADVFG